MFKVMTDKNVVECLQIDNTKIFLCDDYCRDRTPDEVEKILLQIARIAWPYFRADAAANAEGQRHLPKTIGKEGS